MSTDREVLDGPDVPLDLGTKLTSEDFTGKCPNIAKSLIGNYLMYELNGETVGGIITETEAYLGKNDPSCHLASGRTKRNRPFFTGRGTVYVFKIYHHHNLNIISEFHRYPECILIRALQPTHGIDLMKDRRSTSDIQNLTTGPGKLTEALGIKKEQINNERIDDTSLKIYHSNLERSISKTPRIGISEAQDWPLRYCFEKNEYVSKPVPEAADSKFDIQEYYSNIQMDASLPEVIINDVV